MKEVPEVLFVCVHNAGRSQMAAALLDHHAQGRVHVRSAGSTPADEINPAVVAAMDEVGLDLSQGVPEAADDRGGASGRRRDHDGLRRRLPDLPRASDTSTGICRDPSGLSVERFVRSAMRSTCAFAGSLRNCSSQRDRPEAVPPVIAASSTRRATGLHLADTSSAHIDDGRYVDDDIDRCQYVGMKLLQVDRPDVLPARAGEPLGEDEAERLAGALQVLADPSRLRLAQPDRGASERRGLRVRPDRAVGPDASPRSVTT